jgi:UDP:flavonoid glycosyltransferase YjiC (YdhE family)
VATVMFAWELGGGLGHLLQMLPLAEAIARRGHKVFVALRDLVAAAPQYEGRGLFFLQAPCVSNGTGAAGVTAPGRRPTLNFAHVLANVGWHEGQALSALAGAWRNLFVATRPDLVVFDHSPTALLGSRGLPARRVLIGSGFCCPPDTCPLPALAPCADRERLAADEGRVLGRANRALASWRQPPLARLGQLFSEVDENFLTTLEELEQYPGRVGARYWGPVVGAPGGAAPQWPAAPGKRVFAYLKRFASLPQFLAALGERGLPTVVYIDALDGDTRRRFESPALRFERRRVDLPRACRECDLVVLHAGQGATAAALLAGKPVLQVPLVLEQESTARAVVRLGAALAASPKDPAGLAAKLDGLLASDHYAAAARRLAAQYSVFDPAKQLSRMVARVEELLETRRRPREMGTVAAGATPAHPPLAGLFRG